MLTRSACSEVSIVASMAANLASTMSCFGAVRPEAIIRDLDGVRVIDVGPDFATFNAALLTTPVTTERDLEARIDLASRQFDNARGHWCFWICEGLLERPPRRSLERICRRYGLRFSSRTPGLWASSLRPQARDLPELVIRRVADDTSRRSFCHIMTTSFEGPVDQLLSVYGSAVLWDLPFRGYLASWNGVDVAAGASVADFGVLGIYAVATLPLFKRRGMAEAMMRHIVAESAREFGELPIVLQSTPDAMNLYRRLGFEPCTSFDLYSSV